MKVMVKTHQLANNPAATAKAYAEEKFLRLDRFHPALREVEVIFKENGRNMECDVHLLMDHQGTQLVCTSAGDLISAVDIALDRCERQLVRAKEKMRSSRKSGRHRRLSPADPESTAPADPEE